MNPRWLLACLLLTGCASITPRTTWVCPDFPRHSNAIVGLTPCDLYLTRPGGVLLDPVDGRQYRWEYIRNWRGRDKTKPRAIGWELVEVR